MGCFATGSPTDTSSTSNQTQTATDQGKNVSDGSQLISPEATSGIGGTSLASSVSSGADTVSGLKVSGSSNVTVNTGGREIAELANEFASQLSGAYSQGSSSLSSVVSTALDKVTERQLAADSQGVSALQKTMLWGFGILAALGALLGIGWVLSNRKGKSA